MFITFMHGNQQNRFPYCNRTLCEPSNFSNLIGTEKCVAFHFLSLPPTPNQREACFLVTFIHIDVLTARSSLEAVLTLRVSVSVILQQPTIFYSVSLEVNNKDSGNSKSCCFSSSFEGKVEGYLCYIISGKCLHDLHTYHPDYSGKGNLDWTDFWCSRSHSMYSPGAMSTMSKAVGTTIGKAI